MSYNKSKEEKKWKLWKKAEEKKMRELGVKESIIQKLYAMDWEEFKSERRFYENQVPNSELVELQIGKIEYIENMGIYDVGGMLQAIDSKWLFQSLQEIDQTTLQIIFLKIAGFSTEEISRYLRITHNAIYIRINRLKEKIKKSFLREKENGIS